MRSKAHEKTVHVSKEPLLILKTEQNLVGKQWHDTKSAFRPMAGLSSYKQRVEQQKRIAATKSIEREMKEEKESQRQVLLQLAHTTVMTELMV